jgi:phage baseplate assembly protein W
MAFNVERIHPLDLQPRKAVGVSLPFSATNVFNSTYTTQDALRSNLINFLLTNKGERFLNPDFGAGISRLLFEQSVQENKDELETAITSGISTWFPEVILSDLQIVYQLDNNSVNISMEYRVNQTNIQDQLVINVQQ